jgi:hypothetical protein
LIRTGFELPALGWLPMVKVHWEWLWPTGVECRFRLRERRLLEEVVARRRGQVSSIRRRFTVFDAFGLSRVAWEREEPVALTVLPDAGRLRRMPVVQSMASAEGLPHPAGVPEGDRMEIRRYVPGDSARHIMWKAFARNRQLNVRTPERSIDFARKTVAYLVTGDGDEPAAAAARVAIESGALGLDWLFGADGSERPVESLEPALEAIARSGSLPADGGRGGLRAFLAEPTVRAEAHCIVFAPARPGGWTGEALDAGRNFQGRLTFVLGTDGVSRDGSSPLWRRILFEEPREAGTTSEELAELLRTLGSAGWSTVVVDRASGRAHDGGGRQPWMGAVA